MIDFKTRLTIKEESDLQICLNELDEHKISFPESHKEIDEDLVREKLELCSLAQDTVLRVERKIRDDLMILKLLVRNLRTDLRISTNEILSDDDRKISMELKKAYAERQLKDQILDLNEVESWLDYLENALDYVNSKRSDIKQKNYDLKMLYKIYATDKESFNIKSFYKGDSTSPAINKSLSVEDLLEGLD